MAGAMDSNLRTEQGPSLWGVDAVKIPLSRRSSRLPLLHLLLLFATLLTTTFYGALHHQVDVLEEPWKFYYGFPFSLTLMAILGTHELGHYWLSRRHGVSATLPYFIPAPTFIGTFGAFIRIKSIIPDRGALFNIGVAGPIAGFAVALPAVVLGLALSDVRPVTEPTGIGLGSSLLFNGLVWVVLGVTPDAYDVLLHPVAFAGWIGFFVTALNLIPAGQLDGGHLVYSLRSRWHRSVTLLCFASLLPLGWFWPGWWVWAALVLLFSGPLFSRRRALRLAFLHPPLLDEVSPLTRGQKVVGAVAFLIFLLTFPPVPFSFPF